MVEANPAGDGEQRTVQYAKWRDDKPAEAGHSRELINVGTEAAYYDNLGAQPYMSERYPDTTIIQCFKRQVANRGDQPFLGTRPKIGTNEKGQPLFGEYQWQSYRDADQDIENFASGLMAKQLIPEVEGEGRKWRFVGVWS